MFYHTAWRLRTILRNTVAPLPYLSSFEAKGVREVRNKLIEHPEGADSRVFATSRALSRTDGVQIKGGRYSDQLHVFRDLGFAANAEEFRLELEKSLTDALKALAV
jgi:hypothetical protein